MNEVRSAAAIGSTICDGAASADHPEGDLASEIAVLRGAGWLSACLPQAHGGRSWGTEPEGALDAFDALRELGRVNLSVARLFEGHMNAIKLLTLYASPRLMDETAELIRRGTLLGVWGADDPANPVKFEIAGGVIALQGAKRFASGLGLVGCALITASGTDRDQMILVPTDDAARADSSGWQMSGMRATRSGTYDFDGVRLSRHKLVGKPGDMLREPWFEGGIWRYCAAHLGAAETLHSEMCKSLIARGRHEESNQRQRIATSAAAIETMRLWLTQCVVTLEAADASPRQAALSLFAREVTENECRKIIALVEQSLGMAAFVEGTTIERMRRDLSVFLCQARPDAKREEAVATLLAHGTLVEDL